MYSTKKEVKFFFSVVLESLGFVDVYECPAVRVRGGQEDVEINERLTEVLTL